MSPGAEVWFYLPRQPRAPVASALITSVASLTSSLLKWLSCFPQCFSQEFFFSYFFFFLPFPLGFLLQPALLTTSRSLGTCSCPCHRWAEAPPSTPYLPARACFCVYRSAIARAAQQRGKLPFGICDFVRINSQVGCYFPFQLREVVVAAL